MSGARRVREVGMLAALAALALLGCAETPAGGGPDAGALDAGATTGDTGTTAADASASWPPPGYSAVFSTRPADDGTDSAIEDLVVSLIDRAVPGSRIRVAMYSFTRNAPRDALLAAAARGVDVRLVLDGGAGSGLGAEAATLAAGLGADRVVLCDPPGTSCIGTGIMHDKFFLFSELEGGVTNVVVQASHNLTSTQLHLHNNAIVVAGDAALFAGYEQVFADLSADVENPDYSRIVDGDLGSRAYFFPTASGDTVATLLGDVTCDSTSHIRVAMAFFTDARLAVAEALAARQREGCDVEVVAGDASIPLGTNVASTLTSAGVSLIRYPERSGGWTVHSKYLLIDAPFAGSTAHRRVVISGSHNWTGAALTDNDEAFLEIDDDPLYDAFVADWMHAASVATRP